MKRSCRLIFLAFLLLFSLSRGLVAGELEPLKAFNLHPLYIPFIQLLPQPAATLSSGGFGISILESYGNNFFIDPEDGGSSDVDADLDSEASYTGISFKYGLTPRIELDALLYSIYHFGGIMDPLISSYHGLFGFPNGGRELRDEGLLRFYLKNKTGTVLDEDDKVTAYTAGSFELRYAVLKHIHAAGGNWDLSGGMILKFPITRSDYPIEDGGLDGGLRIYAGYCRNRILLAGSTGFILLSSPEYLSEEFFIPWIIPFDLSAVYPCTDRLDLQLTIQGSTSPFDLGYYRTDRFTAVINIGASVHTDGYGDFAFSFTEEFFTFAATDIGLHFGWNKNFPSGN